MKLTDKTIKNVKSEAKVKKLFDGNGLILLVYPNGRKYWSYKYRHLGKEKSLSLGVYPEISLAEARQKLTEKRKLVSDGKDPSEVRKAKKRQAMISAENNFKAVAETWHKNQRRNWTENYAKKVTTSLENDVFPKIGHRPIAEITPSELLSMLRVVENRGALETARRVKQTCGQVFMYAIAAGCADRNPAADLAMALQVPKKTHYAHLKEAELPEFLQKLEDYDGHIQTKLALKMLMLTFVRTRELRGAEWKEINFEKAEWRIPAERMKMRAEHIVPLSKQVIALLEQLHELNREWRYIFPNQHKPAQFMSENTILFALYRMGYHSRATGHGFRSTASTILNERGFGRDAIERQLAHVERNKVRGSYNHAEYLPERRTMMQWWGDFVEELQSSNANKVILLRSGAKA